MALAAHDVTDAGAWVAADREHAGAAHTTGARGEARGASDTARARPAVAIGEARAGAIGTLPVAAAIGEALLAGARARAGVALVRRARRAAGARLTGCVTRGADRRSGDQVAEQPFETLGRRRASAARCELRTAGNAPGAEQAGCATGPPASKTARLAVAGARDARLATAAEAVLARTLGRRQARAAVVDQADPRAVHTCRGPRQCARDGRAGVARSDQRLEAVVHDLGVEADVLLVDREVERCDRASAHATDVFAALVLGARIAHVQELLDLAFGAALVQVVTRDLGDLVADVVLISIDVDAVATSAAEQERDRDESYTHESILRRGAYRGRWKAVVSDA